MADRDNAERRFSRCGWSLDDGIRGEAFHSRLYVEGLRKFLWLGVASTALTMLTAFPLAWFTDGFAYPGASAPGGSAARPDDLAALVGAIGMRQVLGQARALNAGLVHLGLRITLPLLMPGFPPAARSAFRM